VKKEIQFMKSKSCDLQWEFLGVDLSSGEDRTVELKYVDGKIVDYFNYERLAIPTDEELKNFRFRGNE
jgi:hypothetical protein